jgi:hypothetical protein
MSGTKLGWLQATQTKKYLEYLQDDWILIDISKENEIQNSKRIWVITLDYLKKIDPDFDKWYDGVDSPIPQEITWIGNEFQESLKIVWKRIFEVKNKQKES